jgi:hypothetical protein
MIESGAGILELDMTDGQKHPGRVEIKIGNLSFAAEGEQDWLSDQLSKVMKAASSAITPSEVEGGKPSSNAAQSASAIGSLASFLKEKGGESKQVRRFLATAAWLFRRGVTSLTTAAVSAALTENQQKRLGNPADCLNQNVSKGYCEKQKDGFFITPEGWKALGYEQ